MAILMPLNTAILFLLQYEIQYVATVLYLLLLAIPWSYPCCLPSSLAEGDYLFQMNWYAQLHRHELAFFYLHQQMHALNVENSLFNAV